MYRMLNCFGDIHGEIYQYDFGNTTGYLRMNTVKENGKWKLQFREHGCENPPRYPVSSLSNRTLIFTLS